MYFLANIQQFCVHKNAKTCTCESEQRLLSLKGHDVVGPRTHTQQHTHAHHTRTTTHTHEQLWLTTPVRACACVYVWKCLPVCACVFVCVCVCACGLWSLIKGFHTGWAALEFLTHASKVLMRRLQI